MKIDFELVGIIIGGLASIGITYDYIRLRLKETVSNDLHSFRSKRYKCLILLMFTYWNQDQFEKLTTSRSDIRSIEDLEKEIDTEIYNAYLFASKKTLNLLKQFRENPTKENFEKAVNLMRADLWN